MEQNGKIIGKRERIEATFDRYSGEVSREAIIKDDILLHGLNFSERSLKGAYQEKAYYLFTFDSDRPEVVRERPAMIPQEICIQGGSYGLRRTIIQSRHSKDSPYSVDVLDGKRVLLLDGVPVADVSFVPRPAYYGQELRDGMRVEEVAPAIYWGETADVTAFRICEYWNRGKQCLFCDINENFRSWGHLRKGLGAIVPEDIVAESLEMASRDQGVKRYLITGGAILDSRREWEFYLRYIQRAEESLSRKLPSRLNTQALEPHALERFYETGVDYYHPNIEVWDRRLFSLICPGKEENIGRDEWIRRTAEAARLFGTGNVSPNFVAGIEMAYSQAFPHGFRNVEEAVRSTAEGIEILMQNEIVPKFDTWGLEPLSWFGRNGVSIPPLEYYPELYIRYKELKREYSMPWPAGLGEAGAGVSKVPASAFMDA
ncbi:hypothetical protein GCM10007108_13070 [Thermogymnomonas acidicola]|uniref:Radical SAM core domain-containing protein n=1 Tax=Thermogymnomonas acidicola TaxID=399579 RepID=A0AA37BRZ5_9ARCH|nr:radical SAM protein [Thermogymnomonas acidicola]GGM76462.1 hypothetical protein GCM10007108_13070 [Thermogymnomonas acidicola]